MSKTTAKYLSTYAEPVARFVPDGSWDFAVVVPALDERETLPALFLSLEALERPVLVVVVVNARDDATEEQKRSNKETLSWLRGGGGDSSEVALVPRGDLGVLSIDATSPGRTFSPDDGVGLARKMGCDLALAAFHHGKLSTRFCVSTDGDAQLPSDLPAQLASIGPNAAGALLPFEHLISDGPVGEALALYEIWLRYYVQGLCWAGSPFAMPTIGSLIVLSLPHYAAVRGFPKRQAGEDFYLLNKVRKIGPVPLSAGQPVRLAERLSTRVPYGTGPGTQRYLTVLERGDNPTFYAPAAFEGLKRFLSYLDQSAMAGELGRPDSDEVALLVSELSAHKLGRILGQRYSTAQNRKRVLTWFDGFRSLRAVHLLRDHFYPSLPWHDALTSAPWRPLKSVETYTPLAALSIMRGLDRERRVALLQS